MTQYQRESVHEFHTWLRVPGLLRLRGEELPEGSSLARYARGLARMYRAVAEETGAEVIIDSSKEPTDAALLLLMPEIETAFVQIVRDPRGVVYSVLRVRADGQTVAGSRLFHSTYAALSWSAGNVAGAAVRRAAGPGRSMLVRYEDLVSRPGDTMQAVAELAGRPDRLAAFPGPDTVYMHPVHSVGGNNNRFRTGALQLREDITWRSKLHPLDRSAVTAVCAPLMTRYGYQPAS